MEGTTADAERTVRDYVDVWNDGDYERLPDVLSESATVYDPGAPGGELRGRDEFEAHLRELRRGFPDFTISIGDLLSDEGVVMVEWTATGTHRGEFDGIPPTDRGVELVGMSKTLVADGKVREDRIYHDFHDFLDQLGLAGDRE